MLRTFLAVSLLVGATANAQPVARTSPQELSPADRYPWASGAQRPLTVTDQLLTFGLLLGPRYFDPAPLGMSWDYFVDGDIYLRYGITDQLEWGIPFFLTYRFGDLEARDGFEAAIFGGVGGLGISNRGPLIQPVIGFKLRRLLRDNLAFVASVASAVMVSPDPANVYGEVAAGIVVDLNDRWSLDLSVTPKANWIDGDSGLRSQSWALELGGFRRPLVRLHLTPNWELLATAGAEFSRYQAPGGAGLSSLLTLNAGAGMEVRL